MTALKPLAFIGLQLILPVYLREGFVQAALSYIACNGEGEFDCKDNDCWCKCDPKFPQCNCPYMDIQAMEESLQRITETWGVLYKDFEESGRKLCKKKEKESHSSLSVAELTEKWELLLRKKRVFFLFSHINHSCQRK